MTLDLYVGADESNNGRPLEIHTAVFSAHQSDAVAVPSLLPKVRAHSNMFNRLRGRGYSFVLFEEKDKNRLARKDRLGNIVSSLLFNEFDWQEINSVNILLDGNRYDEEVNIMLEMAAETIGLSRMNIHADWGAKYDQKFLIVNLADELAHYLYKRGNPYLDNHKERKALIR